MDPALAFRAFPYDHPCRRSCHRPIADGPDYPLAQGRHAAAFI
ncbi:hypothetical protein [Alkalilimnicola sp. S0819]|nr:hypothetical protein [Alkalilimnicola sp. S0819]